MKRILFLFAFCLTVIISVQAETPIFPKSDNTTRELNSLTASTDSVMLQTADSIHKDNSSVVFNGSSYNLVFSWKKRKKLSPHWTGIGMGFMNYNSDNIPNGKLKMSTSHNFTFNIADFHKQILNSNWLFVSGVGLEWWRYHFDSNAPLVKVNGVTSFVPETSVNFRSNMLLSYYVTFPLLLEYQSSHFHVSGGPVIFMKYYSKSQITYRSDDGKKVEQVMGRDLNIRPVDMKLRLQIGIDDIAVYGFYSPFSMFKKSEGPDMKTYTIGVMIGV